VAGVRSSGVAIRLLHPWQSKSSNIMATAVFVVFMKKGVIIFIFALAANIMD
jgi:hypothetical protein